MASRRLGLEISDAELAARLADCTGCGWLYQQHADGADTGADLDVLKECRGNPVGKDSH